MGRKTICFYFKSEKQVRINQRKPRRENNNIIRKCIQYIRSLDCCSFDSLEPRIVTRGITSTVSNAAGRSQSTKSYLHYSLHHQLSVTDCRAQARGELVSHRQVETQKSHKSQPRWPSVFNPLSRYEVHLVCTATRQQIWHYCSTS